MAFYFALLNVSNAHLDNRLHHGNRRSRSTSSRPTNTERRHSFSSATSNEVVNDYRLLPRPRILSSQSVARPPTPPQRRSHENIASNSGGTAQSNSNQHKADRSYSQDRCDSTTSTSHSKNLTQNHLRNIKKVTFETDRNGEVVNHHSRRVPFLGDPEAWEKGMTGYPTTGHRQPNDENPEYRWKWIAKLRHLSAERRGQRSSSTKESKFLVEPKAHRQRKLVAAVSIADEETEIWTSTPPPAYPGITDTPPEALIETSSDDFSESSPESASRFSSDQSSVSDLFDKKLPSKRKLSGMNRISRKPWRILTENNALDASWKSTKSLITMENFERIFTFNGHRPNTFRILRETSNCSEPISVLN